MSILDLYNLKTPSAQDTVDIFKNEWSTKLPPVDDVEIISGNALLTEAPHIVELNKKFPIQNKTILELGPLEGAHSYTLHQYGAKEIISVESNQQAFMKCLLVKNLYRLDSVQFLFGNAVEYMKQTSRKFDVCIASGILYHMPDPLELLSLCAKKSDTLLLWTHYYSIDWVNENGAMAHKFGPKSPVLFGEITVDYYPFYYKEAINWNGFCGGSETGSSWLSRGDLFEALKALGYTSIEVIQEEPHHPHGACISILARK